MAVPSMAEDVVARPTSDTINISFMDKDAGEVLDNWAECEGWEKV